MKRRDVVAVATLLVLAPSACSAPASNRAEVTASAGSAAATRGADTSAGPVPVTPEDWQAARLGATRDVLGRLLSAVAGDDVVRALLSVDAPRRAEVRPVLQRMHVMRAKAFQVTGLTETVAPVPATGGTRVDYDVRATVDYRLAGFDTEARTFTVDLTVRSDPASPRRAVITDWRAGDRPQPWDLAGVRIRRTGTALLVVAGGARRLDEVAARARTASHRVGAVLGAPAQSVWLAPATDAEAARLLGRSAADLQDVAAATDGPLAPGEPAGADRIVLVPGAWSALSGAGREVVMTHELTHATVRRTTTRDVPLWLSEGLAEFVAYRGVDLPERTLAAPELADVKHHGLPTGTPPDGDFDPTAGRLQAAYALSLLLVRTIADHHGTDGLLRLYHAVSGSVPVPADQAGDPEAVTSLMLRGVLHDDRDSLVRALRQRLRALE